jgi:glutathione S-transferase
MILVGQYDSPFVRRVAIALHALDWTVGERLDQATITAACMVGWARMIVDTPLPPGRFPRLDALYAAAESHPWFRAAPLPPLKLPSA